jgi:hypothetical protein
MYIDEFEKIILTEVQIEVRATAGRSIKSIEEEKVFVSEIKFKLYNLYNLYNLLYNLICKK